MRRRRLALLLLLVGTARAGDEILENGAIGSGAGWNHTPGVPTVTFRVDRKQGAIKRGSLYLANTNESDRAPHNWRTRFDLPKGAPYRLKLSVSVKAAGLRPGSKVNAMVQVRPPEGRPLGYAWCGEVTEDTDWKRIHAVFEVPEGATYVLILSYLVGAGEAWFDDYSVTKTDEPVTGPPGAGAVRADDKHWKLARSCASEIGWHFDAEKALSRARRERKPVLVYVRCTDDREGIHSAQTTLEAAQVRSLDDGMRKDVLFRAGPFSDPGVADLIERRFVPLLVTYHFASHGQGRKGRMDWLQTRGAAELDIDGALRVRNEAATEQGWIQMLSIRSGRAYRLKLKARIKTGRMGRGAEAGVQLNCWGESAKDLGTGRLGPVDKRASWRAIEAELAVPAEFRQLRLFAYVRGEGEAWFDDLSVTDAQGKEYVFNGEADPDRGNDPLERFGLSGADAVTPALLVADADGRLRHKLHRIGTLSTDLVDAWLQAASGDDALEKAARKGSFRALIRLGRLDDAEKALEEKTSNEARLARGLLHLRRGDWDAAHAAFAGAKPSTETEFWKGWCLHRLGRAEEAAAMWKALVGRTDPDRYCRRAAACLMPQGPRLWLSASERSWPRSRAMPEESEGQFPDAFDAADSVRVLLELQNADGSFGSHHGPIGFGFWDGSITAFAAEAFWRWLDHLPDDLRRRAAAAHDRAVDYLAAWSKRNNQSTDAFNNPYVLMHLVRVEKREAGAAVIRRIAAAQNPDGNWTVYQVERPASFNTALNVMALARAKAAGWEVPEKVLADGAEALEAMRQAGDLFPYSTMRGHEWMTTVHGAIARDALCEHALLLAGVGDKEKMGPALERYAKHAHELRSPTKRYFDYFNTRGHGGYYFFFAHRNALEASAHAPGPVRERTRDLVRQVVLAAREGDGAFMDHYMNGRAYGTAQALCLLAPRADD